MSRRFRVAMFLVAAIGLAMLLGLAFLAMPYGESWHPYRDNAVAVALRQTTSNVVSSINFDLRAMDTLGEESILFASVIGAATLLRLGEDESRRVDGVAGVAGAALYLIGHAGAKGALFLLTGLLLGFYGSVDEIGLYRKGVRHRILGVLFVVAALALAGLPPFASGLGKALAEESTHSLALIVLFVLASAITAGAILRAGLR